MASCGTPKLSTAERRPVHGRLTEQCHGNNAMTALQRMLLQADDGKILLFPAWPKEWDVDFKLHAPQNTVIECVYRAGKVQSLKVTPESRRPNVVMMSPG